MNKINFDNFTDEEIDFLNILSQHSNIITDKILFRLMKFPNFQVNFLLNNSEYINTEEYFFINNLKNEKNKINWNSLYFFSTNLFSISLFFIIRKPVNEKFGLNFFKSFLISTLNSSLYSYYNYNKLNSKIETIFIKGFHNKKSKLNN